MFYVYILESEVDHGYYIGCTNDVGRRVREHNSGLSKYTKIKRPWSLRFVEEFKDLGSARLRERQIKSWKKRTAIEKLIKAAFV